jgi:hypothetical protein
MIKNVGWSLCKIPVILVRFQCNLNLRDRFSKTPQISDFKKILPLGAELFRADRQTYRHDEANSRFSQFYESA